MFYTKERLNKEFKAKFGVTFNEEDLDLDESEIEIELDDEEDDKPKPRNIYIYTDINPKVAERVNRDLIEMAMEDSQTPIQMYIHSPGGCVLSGLSIIDTMKGINPPVITIVNGEAASMGALISICGDYRLITKRGFWMAHPMTGGAYGDMETINDRYHFYKELDKVGTKILLKQTKIPEEIIKDKQKLGELWLNSSKCLKYRIVDKVIPCKLNGVMDFKVNKKK